MLWFISWTWCCSPVCFRSYSDIPQRLRELVPISAVWPNQDTCATHSVTLWRLQQDQAHTPQIQMDMERHQSGPLRPFGAKVTSSSWLMAASEVPYNSILSGGGEKCSKLYLWFPRGSLQSGVINILSCHCKKLSMLLTFWKKFNIKERY